MYNSDLWLPFPEIVQDPWPKIKALKEKTGKKIIGHVLPDVPEELIHAAGAIPVALAGAGISISLAQRHIPGYSCSHAMGILELGLGGKLDVIDGLIIPYVCDTTRNLYHLWTNLFPETPTEFLRLPKRIGDLNAKQYLRNEFVRISKWIESITGRPVSRDSLESSFSVYNESRERLRSAYQMMETSPSVWTSSRVISLFESAVRFPREEHLTLMELLPWKEISGEGNERPRIYVRGKVWDPEDITVLFDENGFTLVGDEIVTGKRSVEVDAIIQKDLFEALADRHMAMTPYTGYHVDPNKMIEDFVARIGKSSADGVVFLNPKFCEAAAFDTPDLVTALQHNSIPSLVLETSSRGASLSQIKLRLEAFREILAGDLP